MVLLEHVHVTVCQPLDVNLMHQDSHGFSGCYSGMVDVALLSWSFSIWGCGCNEHAKI